MTKDSMGSYPEPELALEWKEPPPKPVTRLAMVKSMLMERPGEWALIQKQEAVVFLPWWGSLHDDPQFEVRIVGGTRPFDFKTPRDIYARYIGEIKEELNHAGE